MPSYRNMINFAVKVHVRQLMQHVPAGIPGTYRCEMAGSDPVLVEHSTEDLKTPWRPGGPATPAGWTVLPESPLKNPTCVECFQELHRIDYGWLVIYNDGSRKDHGYERLGSSPTETS